MQLKALITGWGTNHSLGYWSTKDMKYTNWRKSKQSLFYKRTSQSSHHI